eukprot:TRINITY_DN23719_c0_g2_i1.p1 TRINITY_DN23719_c0_g2~~TRINITY_DN23719_c0_g2_i1.p1  ORF type:complete len:327 (-),score=24.46 TRINITY_DN23719_c0_g2_i1:894-1838(-)
MQMSSSCLLGRRVEIRGLTSPQGQRLNGQIGGVITQLEAGRVGVRLSQGVKSIHERNLRVRPLSSAEVLEEGLLYATWTWNKEAIRKWPAEVVAFFNAQLQENYSGPDAEAVAFRIHKDFTMFELFAPENADICTLLRYGLSLDYVLKVALRRRLGNFSTFGIHLQFVAGDGRREAAELTCISDAAKKTGRQFELVSGFDAHDLMRVFWAVDTFDEDNVPRLRHVVPALRMLADTLFFLWYLHWSPWSASQDRTPRLLVPSALQQKTGALVRMGTKSVVLVDEDVARWPRISWCSSYSGHTVCNGSGNRSQTDQ